MYYLSTLQALLSHLSLSMVLIFVNFLFWKRINKQNCILLFLIRSRVEISVKLKSLTSFKTYKLSISQQKSLQKRRFNAKKWFLFRYLRERCCSNFIANCFVGFNKSSTKGSWLIVQRDFGFFFWMPKN